MINKELAVTFLQLDLVWEDSHANMAVIEEQLARHKSKSDLIVLPEMFTSGFTMNPENIAEAPQTNTYKWMRMIADQKQAAVMGSYVIKEKGGFYNRLLVVFPGGKSMSYDKRHLFIKGEDAKYQQGNSRLIFEWKGWKIHPLICYDLRFPVWSRSKISDDSPYEYDLLVYVANWPSARVFAWNTLLKARAIENQSYCIGVNRVGDDPNSLTYPGQSVAVNFLGEELYNCGDKVDINTVILDRQSLVDFRDQLPFQLDSDNFSIQD